MIKVIAILQVELFIRSWVILLHVQWTTGAIAIAI